MRATNTPKPLDLAQNLTLLIAIEPVSKVPLNLTKKMLAFEVSCDTSQKANPL